MIPILYKKDAVDFEHNGIGHLTDTVSFKVTDERNSHPELTFQYPITGVWYDRITEGTIVKGKANDTSDLQLFRVYKSSKPLKGIVTFYAKHISCDLKGIPLRALSMQNVTPGKALSTGFASAVLPHRFKAWSDIATLNDIDIQKPRSLRDACGGEAGSVLENWGGEYEFDNFTVKLHKSRGADRGVVINYGKNLTDAKQERNISDCYTHFYPYAIKRTETRNDAGEVVEANEEIITLSAGAIELLNPENIGHTKALTLDITDMFAEGEEITESNLRTHANEYIDDHKLGVPDVNITLSYVQIWDSPEYSNIAKLERVALCDTVTVRFTDLGIDAKAKIIKTEYDGLAERFTKIEVGDPKSNFATTVNVMQNTVTQSETKINDAARAIAQVTVESDSNAANISALSSRVTETEENIGYLEISVAGHRSELKAIAKWQDDTDKSLASIESEASENAARIGLLVETSESGEDSVRGSVLVEAINGQSAATIAADKVNLTGYVTVSSLKAGGSTVIDGSRIQTGQIVSQNFLDEYAILKKDIYPALDAGPYKFDFNGKEYGFITTKAVTIGGSIRFYETSKKVETLDSFGNIIETLNVTEEGSGLYDDLKIDNIVYFSESGTKIDLENGEIIAPQFAMKNDGSAYFGGKLNVLSGRLGPFLVAELGLYTQYPNASLDNGAYLGLYAGGFDFASDRDYDTANGYVQVKIGDSLPPKYGGKPHEIKMYNTNGDILFITPTDAQLIGAWKATPYKDPTKAVSEIVTKQDLIDLGLITA